MSQIAHIDIGAEPVDIAAGLPAGRYVGQVRTETLGPNVLYATADAAPADLDAYFAAGRGDFFTFCVPGPPTWARLRSPDASVTTAVIARAAVDD